MTDLTARGYELPHPDNIAREDAARVRRAIEQIDSDLTDIEGREASEAGLGNVRLATTAEAAAGVAEDRVGTIKRVKDMIVSAINALQSWVAEQLADLEAELDQANADLEQAFTTALAGKVSTTAVGTGANKIVAFDSSGKYPAGDASALTRMVPKRNMLVNGAFVNARAPGELGAGPMTFNAGTSAYMADQWYFASAGSAWQVTASQQAIDTPGGSSHRLRLVVNTAKPVLAAGDYIGISQHLSGDNVKELRLGTAGARFLAVSFGVKLPAGIYPVRFMNGAGDRSYRSTFTIAAGEANQEMVKTLVVPGDVTGTWGRGIAMGLHLTICLVSGTSFQGVANAWGAGQAAGVAGMANFLSSTSNVFELFDAGLYEGQNAPPFAPKSRAVDLAECNYFWQRVAFNAGGDTVYGSGIDSNMFFSEMRAAPTATGIAGGTTYNLSNIQVVAAFTNSVWIFMSPATAGQGYNARVYYALSARY